MASASTASTPAVDPAKKPTPFISRLDPTPLTTYNPSLPPSKQPNPSSIPPVFLDAMTVREAVFVQEQGVPLENEFDSDDSRSLHFVIYASVNRQVEPAVYHPKTGSTIRPRRGSTSTVPIGTIRLVPYPHPCHPHNGGSYAAGQLINAGDPVSKHGIIESTEEKEGKEAMVQPLSTHELRQLEVAGRRYGVDRATTYHNGHEPYIQVGRLAVLKEYRGQHIAHQLVHAAVEYAQNHPACFSPALSVLRDGVTTTDPGTPKWRGLMGCHAQEKAVAFWAKMGFQVDKGMGRWLEEGIPHVGMFMRVPVAPEVPEPPPGTAGSL